MKRRFFIGISSTVAFLIIFSSFSLAMAQQQPTGANWVYPEADVSNSNYSPQTAITVDNVKQLALKWIFTIPTAPPDVAKNVSGGAVTEGVGGPPLVNQGIVYLQTYYDSIIALNAGNGKVLWTFQAPFNPNRGPILTAILHNHGSIVIHGGALYFLSADCILYIMNPFTGDVRSTIGDLCLNIPGNNGFYAGEIAPAFNDKAGVLYMAPTMSHGSRGYISAYDLKTGKLLWRFFNTPPEGSAPKLWDNPGPDNGKLWDIAEQNLASKGNIDPSLVTNDWGLSNPNAGLYAGGGIWNQIVVDQDTGIVYYGSGNPAPAFNASSVRPGPNLFTTSVMALDGTTGTLLWYYQTTPHDVLDRDCSWGTKLVTVTIGGTSHKTVIQGCKQGYLYVLDTTTGKPIWTPELLPGVAQVNNINANAGNKADMTVDHPPLLPDGTFAVCPDGPAGALESPGAFAYNAVYAAIKNDCMKMTPSNISPQKSPSGLWWAFSKAAVVGPTNSTVSAVDASNGAVKWTYFVPDALVHGGCCLATGHLVFFGDNSGLLRALDADNGTLLWQMSFGSSFATYPSIGATASGETLLFVPASGGLFYKGTMPGALVALGAPAAAAPSPPGVSLTLFFAVATVAVVFVIATGVLAVRRRKPVS